MHISSCITITLSDSSFVTSFWISGNKTKANANRSKEEKQADYRYYVCSELVRLI